MAFTKINENDYANKGIRTKSNPLNMSVTDAQRAFDELPLDVIIPKVNALSEEIDEYAESTDIKIENLKTRATNSEEALETKVAKEEGKALSTNDYSNEEKQKVAEAYTDKHTHENQDVLDGVTAEKVAEWDSKVDAQYVNDTVNDKITELGAADMMQATYDPQRKQTDIFKYVDDAVDGVTAEDVGARPDTWLPTAADVGASPSSHTHTAAEVGAAEASHNQAANTITAGTFPATAIKAKTGTDYTTARVRNIYATTTDLTAGTSSLSSGNICLVYEA